MATDRFGILPDDFIETWNNHEHVDKEITTIEEALTAAEGAPSSTDPDQMPRCPYCSSIRLRKKPGHINQEQKVDTKYACYCKAHFDTPAPPAAEAPNYDFIDKRDTPFEWTDADDRADPDDRGESHELRGLEDDTLTELVIRLYKPWTDGGPSYRDLSQLVPHSREWVGRRVRAWNRGDLRDLVRDPRGPTATDDTATVAATDGGKQPKNNRNEPMQHVKGSRSRPRPR